MIRYLYTFLLFLLSPVLLFTLYKKKEGKPAFGYRWKEHFGCTPKQCNSDQRPIWIHAVSVGETLAVIPLIQEMKRKDPSLNIIITTTTSTGAQQAEKISDIAEHRYMPIDLPFAIKRFIKTINPQQLLIMETELWPNVLHYTAKKNIPITIINARLSERSKQRYEKVPKITSLLFKNIANILCQTEPDRTRFIALGMKAEKVHTAGNLKFDITIPDCVYQQGQDLRSRLGKDRPIWIAASTHDNEEQQILEIHKDVLTTLPNALLIIVPRHPERFSRVYDLSIENGFRTEKRTSNQPDHNLSTSQVYLADTMGEMLLLLQAADICFMGGSLIGNKVGGHNVLEPASLGKLIIMGPSYYNFKSVTEDLISLKACYICTNQLEIKKQLIELIKNKEHSKNIVKETIEFINNSKGAINKTISMIFH